MDVERIRVLGRGLVLAGAVLALGAFAVGWSLPQPALSAVWSSVAVALGPPLAGLAMMRVTSPNHLYRLVYLPGVASMAAVAAHLHFVVRPAELGLSTALSTLLYLVLIVAPVMAANIMAIWITFSLYLRTRRNESGESSNEQTRFGG
ncbi:hypothetical protein ABZX92_01690 [Lentzea sp. NPDC006480]|uniref:hypothetical protein n=1 Tax=Lentzea sp. NPDC006480 TaxID=3157176 RepID=UPI0033A3076A